MTDETVELPRNERIKNITFTPEANAHTHRINLVLANSRAIDGLRNMLVAVSKENWAYAFSEDYDAVRLDVPIAQDFTAARAALIAHLSAAGLINAEQQALLTGTQASWVARTEPTGTERAIAK